MLVDQKGLEPVAGKVPLPSSFEGIGFCGTLIKEVVKRSEDLHCSNFLLLCLRDSPCSIAVLLVTPDV